MIAFEIINIAMIIEHVYLFVFSTKWIVLRINSMNQRNNVKSSRS